MRLIRTSVSVVGILVLLASCGGGRSASTVRADPRDAGRTIHLHRGDHLLVDLGSRWKLSNYPTDVLRLDRSEDSSGVYSFTVMSTGQGIVRAVGSCGPPVPGRLGNAPACIRTGTQRLGAGTGFSLTV